jgi:3-oxoacyl-[acyl-carrier protein] reductase/2-deoxy-D-gluconate 3-dehydrogenase
MQIKGLKDRVAVVTAAGQNLGKAIALALADAGAHVIVNGGSSQKKVDEVAAEARRFGVEARAVVADGTDQPLVEKMIADVVQEFGRIDIAVSCVGIRPYQPLEQITLADWQKVINTNLGSAFILSQAVLPHMRARKFGRVIFVTGSGSMFPQAYKAHVVVSKHGIHGLAKAIATEYGPDGVTANSVAPGWLDTTRTALEWYPNLDDTYARLRASLPLRRLGDAEDISNACVYLASDMGKFVTGHLLHVNGGEFML